MPDPSDIDVTAAPATKKADAPKAAPAPEPAPAPVAKPEKPAKNETAKSEVLPPVRYRVIAHCDAHLPGAIVDREGFRPNAPFDSDGEAETATDAVIARLLSLGVIAPE